MRGVRVRLEGRPICLVLVILVIAENLVLEGIVWDAAKWDDVLDL